MSGKEGPFGGGHHGRHRHLGDYHVHLYLGKQIHGHLHTTVVLGAALLYAAAQHLGHRHAGDADGVHGTLQYLEPGLVAEDGHLGKLHVGGRDPRLLTGHQLYRHRLVLTGPTAHGHRLHRAGEPARRHKVGIGRGQAVLLDVQALDLLLGGAAQADGVLEHQKYDGNGHQDPHRHREHADALGDKEGGAAAIEKAAVHRQQASEQSTHGPTDAMDRDGAHWVVDLGYLVKKFNRKRKDDAGARSDDGGAEDGYHVASGGDGYQAAQSGVEGHGHIRLTVPQPGKDHGDHAGHCRRHVGGAEDGAGHRHGAVSLHGDSGAAIEAKPAEPEDKHAQGRDGEVVSQDGLGLAVLVILADPGPQDLSAHPSGNAAYHVDGGGACEVMEAQLGQPAAAPDPVAGHRVNDQGDHQGVDAVGDEFGPLRHGAGDDGGRRGAEDRLEDKEGGQRHAIRQNGGVVAPHQGVKAAD